MKNEIKKNKRKKIGVIGVDAGLCWIGDPCYVVAKDSSEVFEKWDDFVLKYYDNKKSNQYKQFNYKLGHPGLGVCVRSGHGDGEYPVYAEFTEDGIVKSVTVEFI